jgi:hypothetical protein
VSLWTAATAASARPIAPRPRQADRAEASGHHRPYGEAAGGGAGQQTRGDRADGRGQFGEPGLQGSAALDELQELGEEEDQAGEAEDGQQIGEHRAGETPVVEEPHVEQRGGEPELPAYEPDEHRQAAEARDRDLPASAVCGELLDGVDDPDHADQGEQHAQRVPRSGRRVLRLGDHLDPDHHEHRHDRQVDQEDRAPPEVLQQEPADDGSDGGARRCHRSPDADGEAPLPRVVEEVADQGEGGRHQGGAGDTEQGPRQNHHLGRLGVGVEHGDRTEGGGSAQQQLLAADAVTEAAHGDQEPGDDEGVDVTDPEQLGTGRFEVLAEERGREAQHGGVDGHQQHGEDEYGQRDPPPGAVQLVRGLGLPFHAAHCSTLRRAPPSSNSTIMYAKSCAATRPA